MGPKRAVKLDVLVQADGRAAAITIIRGSGYDPLDQAAVAAARRASYLPAVDHGMAVSEHMPLELSFELYCAPGDSGADCRGFPRR